MISRKVKLILAFAAIYLIWGSTYLAIRFAVDSLPPFLMAGTRFLSAGVILFFSTRRGRPAALTLVHWRSAAIVGGLLFLGGNGLLSWAEQSVDSGVAALVLATIPVWMVIFHSIVRRRAPGWKTVFGIVLGFSGVFFLVYPREAGAGPLHEPAAFVALLCAAFFWAGGSIYSREARLPDDIAVSTSLQLVTGGLLLLLAGAATGEYSRLDVLHVTVRSILSLGYLLVFGSLVAFSAYAWLLRVSEPAHVGTYAFVNPVVAVLLGVLLGGERLDAATVAAGVVIVAGVVTIHIAGGRSAVR